MLSNIKMILAKFGFITLIPPAFLLTENSLLQETKASNKEIVFFELDDKEIFDTALASHCTHSGPVGT